MEWNNLLRGVSRLMFDVALASNSIYCSFSCLVVIGWDNSVSQAMYIELNKQIEQMSRLFHFIAMKISVPSTTIPALLLTLFNYFILDLGNESYYLASPMMYVQNTPFYAV